MTAPDPVQLAEDLKWLDEVAGLRSGGSLGPRLDRTLDAALGGGR